MDTIRSKLRKSLPECLLGLPRATQPSDIHDAIGTQEPLCVLKQRQRQAPLGGFLHSADDGLQPCASECCRMGGHRHKMAQEGVQHQVLTVAILITVIYARCLVPAWACVLHVALLSANTRGAIVWQAERTSVSLARKLQFDRQ